MTANLLFITANEKNALLVPNAALRWNPNPNQIAPDVRGKYLKAKSKRRSVLDVETVDHGVVWVKDDEGFVRPIQLRLGASDSVNTVVLQVLRGELNEGTEVVIGEGHAQSGSNAGNPFTPQIFKKKQQSNGS
jgi:HlyD family secretion protein